MGVPWLAQVRLLHMAILVLATATCLLYVAYITSPQLTTTASPLRTLASEIRAFQGNTTQAEAARNITAAPPNSGSSEAPQPQVAASIAVRNATASNSSQPDMTRGIAAEIIYEAGHVDVSSQMCPDLGRDIKLLIAITSAPSHEGARMAIRETWGHFASRKDIGIAFMLGSISNETVNSNIEKEQYLYGDIIRGKFRDTYDNLTLKTISMLEWVDNYCPKAAFVLKTDDDMFINVSRLLAFIAKHSPEQRAIYGRLAKKWKPIRNKKSKYYISPNQYKPAVFPDFTTGPAYLLPARLSKELYVAALNHTYFKLEDVFVTGIVANSLKIKRIHAPEFLNKRVSLTPCSVQRGISIHMVRGVEQYDLWKKLHDVAAKCKK
ncbi:hypothetical protein Zmor_002999 [Zophobas morio]|uniref:Hexosyltransferase n=2 Tax=Zophobas morio TaxID=2755281 RepID=A0AA38M1N0_9CUCU|nr:hypothetical protein Zmor_002999 [Zophobas morio]